MTDQELRKLNRQDLLRLLLETERENERLRKELEDAKQQLKRRKVIVSEAGNLAEASLKLSGVFEDAQRAADIYVQNAQQVSKEQERKAKEALLSAERSCRKMEEACREEGMRFYVSDAHFKERCCNGSCCGLPADWNYSRGQFCEALQIAKKRGFVVWDDIKGEVYRLLGKVPWSRAEGYNSNSCEKRAKFDSMSMADYMRWLWNNPQTGQSPYKLFEGVLVPKGKDKEGNLIYGYNETRKI